MTDDDRLVDLVAEKGRLESTEEAEDVIRSVTGSMAGHLGSEAWELVSAAIPDRLVGEPSGKPGAGAGVDDLFADVGGRRRLSDATAARYVRLVSESVREMLTDSETERLQEVLDDEFLALFEVHHRGELTEEDGATPGATQIGTPPDTSGDDQVP